MKHTNSAMRGLALVTLFLALAPVAFGQVIRDFSAVGASQGVFLQWTTLREAGVSEFRVQRSFDGQRFHTIHTVRPTGSNHTYNYTDDDLFKGPQQTYYYRIEIASNEDNLAYSPIEEVALNFSGIRRTWGSIKAMFR